MTALRLVAAAAFFLLPLQNFMIPLPPQCLLSHPSSLLHKFAPCTTYIPIYITIYVQQYSSCNVNNASTSYPIVKSSYRSY